MAIKSTIYKVDLSINDMDRHYYETHKLTLACHPSETELRLMVRILAFCFHAHERLEFGKGISDHDEPDLWQKDLAGDVDLWIELGNPDERIVTKACGRAKEVVIYSYQGGVERWWDGVKFKLAREKKLRVIQLDPSAVEELSTLADRGMNLSVSIQDGEAWIQNQGDIRVHIIPQVIHP